MPKIMIVDEDIRFVVRKMFEDACYRVVEAQDRTDCLKKINKNR